jgi:hypothetical protein
MGRLFTVFVKEQMEAELNFTQRAAVKIPLDI